ncbi:MAG: hypothetical protein ACOCVZ_07150 [Gemmatimonadota bacterium]
MRQRTIVAMLVLSVLGMAACDEEDPTEVITAAEELEGTWLSKGDDLAPGFVPLGVDSIIATFNDDQTYEVFQFALGNTAPAATLTGTYVTGDEAEGEVNGIILTQLAPNQLTAEGIYQVTGNSMRYEVVQTQPDIGAVPPTVAEGFGSTVVGGSETSAWIQSYDLIDDD